MVRVKLKNKFVTLQAISFSLADRADHSLPHVFAQCANSLAALIDKIEAGMTS